MAENAFQRETGQALANLNPFYNVLFVPVHELDSISDPLRMKIRKKDLFIYLMSTLIYV
jgi:hypothetical protein